MDRSALMVFTLLAVLLAQQQQPNPQPVPRSPPELERLTLLLDGAPATALDSLVAAERAFSALSVRAGVRTAFLTHLSDSGVLFRPLPVNGKQVWSARAEAAGTLIWEPSHAEVAAAGDLGYTTGPWEFRRPGDTDGDSTGHGHFISTWRREPGAGWRVAADIGVSHQRPIPGVAALGAGRPTLHEPGPVPPQRHRPRDLRELDRSLGRAMSARGAYRGFDAVAAADVRFNTEGAFPLRGAASIRPALDTLSGSWSFIPGHASLAASADLGYTWGVIERRARGRGQSAPDSTVYLHVWRRAPKGDWRLALAVWNPLGR